MRPTLTKYRGYPVISRGAGNMTKVEVWDPLNKRGLALYETTSLDSARAWIDAYRAGETHALNPAPAVG